jgi:hypothetical protein
MNINLFSPNAFTANFILCHQVCNKTNNVMVSRTHIVSEANVRQWIKDKEKLLDVSFTRKEFADLNRSSGLNGR